MLYISKIHVKIVLQTKLLRHSFSLHWHRIGIYLVYVWCSEENYQKVSIYHSGTGRSFFLDDRWKLPNPIPPQVAYFLIVFFFCFLIILVNNDFCFCLRSCDGKFSRFVHFPCILECCFSFSF